MHIFQRFYPDLPKHTQDKLILWMQEIRTWNEKVNLISRKDIEHLEENHLLPSLAFQEIIQPQPGMQILDIGTGGGCPGIPLAICHPEAQFLLVDSIGKKIEAIRGMVEALGLQNVRLVHSRVETLPGKFDLVLGRAVAALPLFLGWAVEKLKAKGQVAYLKGGPLEAELEIQGIVPKKQVFLNALFPSMHYEEKYIVCFDAHSIRKLSLGPRP